MDRPHGPDSLFRASFLEKGLVTFAECVDHYGAHGPDALLDEMRLLLTAPMLAIPFSVSSARYYALMYALIRCAGRDGDLNEAQRSKLVRFCIDIGLFLRGRTAEGRADAFDTALDAALEAARASLNHPEVAGEILRGIRPAPGKGEPELDLEAATAAMRALEFADPPLMSAVAASA